MTKSCQVLGHKILVLCVLEISSNPFDLISNFTNILINEVYVVVQSCVIDKKKKPPSKSLHILFNNTRQNISQIL